MSRYRHTALKGTSWAIECSCCSRHKHRALTSMSGRSCWDALGAPACTFPTRATPHTVPPSSLHRVMNSLLWANRSGKPPGLLGLGFFFFFLATLPEMFGSAGKKMLVLLRRFLGCLPGRLRSISLCLQGGEGAGRGGGWRKAGRDSEEEEEALLAAPGSKDLHWNLLSPQLACQRKRNRRTKLFWLLQKRQRLTRYCWCRRGQRRKHLYLEQFSLWPFFPISNPNSFHQCPLCTPHSSQPSSFLICPLYYNLVNTSLSLACWQSTRYFYFSQRCKA